MRVQVFGARLIDTLGRGLQGKTVQIQRLAGLNIHNCPYASFGEPRFGRFVNRQHIDQLRGYGVKVEVPPGVVRGQFAAIEGSDAVAVPQAADQYVLSLAAVAGNGHPGNTLQCFGQVFIRKLAYIIGHHKIHHCGGILFQKQRLLNG